MRTRVKNLFHEVADLSADTRNQYFDDHGIDAKTRGEVEALLAYDLPSSTFLGRDIGEAAERALAGMEGQEMKCGPYRLSALLGRGGMGAVYLAERVDGEVTQRVAVKLLRPGVDDRQLRERFLAERQILATLSHPNIARLLDAGHREDAQPYLVMEYVEGKAIDVYTAGMGIGAKIAIFLKVCAAVGYLHRNLVVHRDLKPSNILVTSEGEPKLLDFGIAKMLDLTTDETVTTLRMLTPNYASPEQVAGGALSTATDVYSLGGVLHKLLTGEAPNQSIRNGILAPMKLAPSLKGDLQTILRKALRSDAQERYGSIEQFADDLENYLHSRPIRARQGDTWYRTRKLARRYWFPIAAAILAVAGLSGGVLAANHQRSIAQRRFAEVRQLANVFLFDFERSIRDVPGTLDARNLVASTGQRYLKQLAAESRYDPALAREIAMGYQRLADIQDSIQAGGGKSPGVTESLRQSLDILRGLGDNESKDRPLRRKYIELAAHLGFKYQDEHNATGALQWANEAMSLGEAWVNGEPRSVDALAAATGAFSRGATTHEIGGRTADALRCLEKAAVYAGRATAAAPADETLVILASDIHRIHSEMLDTVKRYPEALAEARQALQSIEPLWKRQPRDPRLRLKFINANSAVGISGRALGAVDPKYLKWSLPFLERAYNIADEAMRAEPRNSRLKKSFVTHSSRLSSLLVDMKRFNDAERIYQRAKEATRELTVQDPGGRRSWYLLGKIELDLGWMHLESGDRAKAQQAFLASSEGFERGLEMDPADTVILECRAGQFEGLARLARMEGDSATARRWMERCLETMRGMVARDPSVRTYIYDYAAKLKLARDAGLSTAGLE